MTFRATRIRPIRFGIIHHNTVQSPFSSEFIDQALGLPFSRGGTDLPTSLLKDAIPTKQALKVALL